MPEKEFFIGVDSDGTAFDSMSPKHYDAFIPSAIETWNLQEYAEKVTEVGANINLYSKHRGVNRFPGLILMFDELSKSGINIGDYTPLREYVNSSEVYSNTTLEDYIKKNPSDFLSKVLEWSKNADCLFSAKVDGIQPFEYVRQALKQACVKADITVVSSASSKGLLKDWQNGGIAEYTHSILGQENGTKKQQLKSAVSGNYKTNHILMIGDAPGDYEAAKSVNALFYPIIPGSEVQSWKEFCEVGCDKFFSGSFSGQYQDDLLNKFLNVLS